jgi:hypothetical protein
MVAVVNDAKETPCLSGQKNPSRPTPRRYPA